MGITDEMWGADDTSKIANSLATIAVSYALRASEMPTVDEHRTRRRPEVFVAAAFTAWESGIQAR